MTTRRMRVLLILFLLITSGCNPQSSDGVKLGQTLTRKSLAAIPPGSEVVLPCSAVFRGDVFSLKGSAEAPIRVILRGNLPSLSIVADKCEIAHCEFIGEGEGQLNTVPVLNIKAREVELKGLAFQKLSRKAPAVCAKGKEKGAKLLVAGLKCVDSRVDCVLELADIAPQKVSGLFCKNLYRAREKRISAKNRVRKNAEAEGCRGGITPIVAMGACRRELVLEDSQFLASEYYLYNSRCRNCVFENSHVQISEAHNCVFISCGIRLKHFPNAPHACIIRNSSFYFRTYQDDQITQNSYYDDEYPRTIEGNIMFFGEEITISVSLSEEDRRGCEKQDSEKALPSLSQRKISFRGPFEDLDSRNFTFKEERFKNNRVYFRVNSEEIKLYQKHILIGISDPYLFPSRRFPGWMTTSNADEGGFEIAPEILRLLKSGSK